MKQKILFVMFQGAGTNSIDTWSDGRSGFLNRLKQLGKTYIYQNKMNNIFYYTGKREYKDFPHNINFNLEYVDMDAHIKGVYANICAKIKNIDDYIFVPIGWSAGGYFAMTFAQIYAKKCILCVLLDSNLIEPKNISMRLNFFKNLGASIPLNNSEFCLMLSDLKKHPTNEKVMNINSIIHYHTTSWISKYLNPQFAIPTIGFMNIDSSENKIESKDWTMSNTTKKREKQYLMKKNAEGMYIPIMFTDQTHCVFCNVKPAKQIITEIKLHLEKQFV